MLCGDLSGKEIQGEEGLYVYVQLMHFAIQ